MAVELVRVHVGERAKWEELFAAAGPTSLLQSWAWGEAKAVGEGWTPYRFFIHRDGATVGLVQVLEKRVAGVLRLARLNRGPVWLETVDTATQREALCLVAANWRSWRGGILFLAPEMIEENAPGLKAFGLFRRKTPRWCSSWIDLSLGTDALHKRLDPKWRNKLAGAQRAGVTVEAMSTSVGLEWLMEHYQHSMRDKSFIGTPPPLIRQLAAHAGRPDDLLVLRAVSVDGEAVGGVLLARHGDSATYLVGWNGELGRRLKANNLLLWHAVLELEARGCRWFDLGGIDEVLTPSIAVFKRGMKGEEYTLAGEYLWI